MYMSTKSSCEPIVHVNLKSKVQPKVHVNLKSMSTYITQVKIFCVSKVENKYCLKLCQPKLHVNLYYTVNLKICSIKSMCVSKVYIKLKFMST